MDRSIVSRAILVGVPLIPLILFFGNAMGVSKITLESTATVIAATAEEVVVETPVAQEETKNSVVREVTMYTSTREQTDASPCTGASGENQCDLWEKGTNICASNAFPLGTVLQVENLGTCIVKDRMNSRYAERIDWYGGFDHQCLDGVHSGDYCPNYMKARAFGKKNLNVSVVVK